MRFRLSIVLLTATVTIGASAAAQEPSPQELFRQSAGAYREGRFQEAADLLRRAHEIDPAPILQYNLARALEGLGDVQGAIEAYEAYLEGEPEAEDRGSIEARLVTLRRQMAERRALAEASRREEVRDAAEPDEPVAAPSRSPSDAGPSAAPWVIAGVGVVALGVAVGLGAVAQDTNTAAMDEPVHQRRVELVDEAHGYALAANLTFAAGGAIALAGMIWGIVDVASSGGDDAGVDVEVAVGPGGVAIRGAF